MACCFKSGGNDEPITEEMIGKSPNNEKLLKYLYNPEKFDIDMLEAPCEEPCCCLLSGCPFTCLCAQMKIRYDTLNHIYPGSHWTKYKCCQGYFAPFCCYQPGNCGEQSCPACCLCLEVWCCAGPAASVTRAMMMDKYRLGLDQGDRRLIQFNNCLQGLLVLTKCINLFAGNDRTRDCERALQCIANVYYFTIQGCMLAQVHREIKKRGSTEAPEYQRMDDRE
mmetsp:Transcript_13848/g.21250  ORF Transcript_13848/g.21250 Transcript_13848/m.21250 type:complete len:223 (-) Transcript_13848:1207-1875(-)|eukprot:CAMPEP_0196805718 /NCGR_PEP_ID=MMETSP1362-20130617/5530_1 /TAXON_ID=163516 /ORGANISM="Leptocylindrus danicus, Strain CCMP1856" /LENGTH=222 /DNA_ID=CAMNT_0042178815 /DNA_START=103 /DNA_END=771 /DNA_ORIENTATION=-